MELFEEARRLPLAWCTPPYAAGSFLIASETSSRPACPWADGLCVPRASGGSFCKSLDHPLVLLRVPWPAADVREGQFGEQPRERTDADAHLEAPLQDLPQVDAAPPDDAVGRPVRTGLDEVGQCPHLLLRQKPAPARTFAEIGRAHVCTQVTNAHLVCR